MDCYLSNHLRIAYKPIKDFVLVDIARNGNQEEIIQLVKLVVLAILNCPYKPKFVEKITKLGETDQFALMNFIKIIIKDKRDSNHVNENESENEYANEKEITELRKSNNLLAAQLAKLELDLEAVIGENIILNERNQEIALDKLNLEHSLHSHAHMPSTENIDAFYKLEKQLVSKTAMVEISKHLLETSRVNHEKEINKLKEELELAKVQSHLLHISELKSAKLAEKLEGIPGLKNKYRDLKAANESMQKLISEHQREIASYSKSKITILELKASLGREKSRTSALTLNLEAKDQLIKENNKVIQRLKENIESLESQIIEQGRSCDSSFISNDDLHLNRLEAPMESGSISHGIIHSGPGHIQNMINMLSYRKNQQMEIERKKEKINRLREALQMQREEFMGYKFVDFHNIQKVEGQNIGLVDKIHLLSEQISSIEVEKVDERYKLELENSLQKNEELSKQIEKALKEKDEAINRCIEARSVSIELGKKIELFETGNQESRVDSERVREKIPILGHFTGHKLFESMENPIVVANEEPVQNTFQLTQEVLSLKRLVIELKNQLDLTISSKSQTISLLEMNHKDEIERIQNEATLKYDEMVESTKSALEKVHIQQDRLYTRLKSERKSTHVQLNRAITLHDVQLVPMEEVNHIKHQLASVIVENEKLGRDYQEIVLCWKDSNRMVRKMQRAMDNEAKKMQAAVNIRKSKASGLASDKIRK